MAFFADSREKYHGEEEVDRPILYSVVWDLTGKDAPRYGDTSRKLKKLFVSYRKLVIKRLISREMIDIERAINDLVKHHISNVDLDPSHGFNNFVQELTSTRSNFSEISKRELSILHENMSHAVPLNKPGLLQLGYKYCFGTKRIIKTWRCILRRYNDKTHNEYEPNHYHVCMYLMSELCSLFSDLASDMFVNSPRQGMPPKHISRMNAYLRYSEIMINLIWERDVKRSATNRFMESGGYIDPIIRAIFMEGCIYEGIRTYSDYSLHLMSSLYGKSSVNKRWSKHKSEYYPIIEDALNMARKMWENESKLKNDKMLELLLEHKDFKNHAKAIRWKLKEELKKVAEEYGMKRLGPNKT